MTAASAQRTPSLLALCGLALACYVGSFIRLPVIPLFAGSLGLGPSAVGVINGAFFLTAAVFSAPAGRWGDRVGRRRAALTGLALMAAGSVGLCFSRGLLAFAAGYAALGLGVAAFTPSMMALVAEVSPPGRLGRSYGWYTTSLYVGMSLGPALGGALAEHLGFVPALVVSTGLLAVALGWAAAVLPRVAARQPPATPRAGSWARAFAAPGFGACILATLGGCVGLGMFTTYLPLHAAARQLSAAAIGATFLLQGLCNAGARIPAGSWSDRLGSRRGPSAAGLVGLAAALAGLGSATGFGGFAVGAVAFGISMGVAFTSIAALTVEAVPAELRGTALGIYNTSIFVGLLVSSVAMGPVVEWLGYPAGFWLAAAGLLLVAGLFWRWSGKHRAAPSSPLSTPGVG